MRKLCSPSPKLSIGQCHNEVRVPICKWNTTLKINTSPSRQRWCNEYFLTTHFHPTVVVYIYYSIIGTVYIASIRRPYFVVVDQSTTRGVEERASNWKLKTCRRWPPAAKYCDKRCFLAREAVGGGSSHLVYSVIPLSHNTRCSSVDIGLMDVECSAIKESSCIRVLHTHIGVR